jgi:thymidylate synthase (FAD)
MKIIKPSAEIVHPAYYGDFQYIMDRLERAARTCYKSEDKIGPGSAEKLLRNTIKRGHESVLEHESISVRFICDRGVSHELVRHRLASFSQESTRYCNYGKAGELTFIEPCFLPDFGAVYDTWIQAMRFAEGAYLSMLKEGATPQEARSVLPNSLKTELVMTANIREWRLICRLRADKAAHPQMRELVVPLLKELKTLLPVLFEDIWPEIENPSQEKP